MQPSNSQLLKQVGDRHNRYDIIKPLGNGSSSCVYLGQKQDGEMCAIKIVRQQTNHVRAEIAALEDLADHHCILTLANYGVDYFSPNQWFFELQLCPGGDLLGLVTQGGLRRHGTIPAHIAEMQAKSIMFNVFAGCAFAHSQGWCHRDIKLENVLLTSDPQKVKYPAAVIADWGLASRFSRHVPLRQDCGSLHYAAPEILRNHPYFGDEVDTWSLGILLFALVTGCFPFSGNSPRARLADIYKRNERIPFPQYTSIMFRDLCSRLLRTNPQNRISAAQALEHPWFADLPSRQKKPALIDPFAATSKMSTSVSPVTSSNSSSSSNSPNHASPSLQHPRRRRRRSSRKQKATSSPSPHPMDDDDDDGDKRGRKHRSRGKSSRSNSKRRHRHRTGSSNPDPSSSRSPSNGSSSRRKGGRTRSKKSASGENTKLSQSKLEYSEGPSSSKQVSDVSQTRTPGATSTASKTRRKSKSFLGRIRSISMNSK